MKKSIGFIVLMAITISSVAQEHVIDSVQEICIDGSAFTPGNQELSYNAPEYGLVSVCLLSSIGQKGP